MNNKKSLKWAALLPAVALFLMSSTPIVMPESNQSALSVMQEEKTGVYAENPTFDFGTISRTGDKVTGTFVIHNASDKAVSIATVNASCGCTTADWTKDPIAPEKTGTVKVAFNPKGQFGTINKKVTVTLDSGERIVMNIKGIVE